jgi:hypothetical protein
VTLLGALLLLGGGAGAGWALRAATSRRRPLDLVAALAGPLFVACALVGGILCCAPGFLRSP